MPAITADQIIPGIRLDRLRVDEFVGITINGRRKLWRCTCVCGAEVVVAGGELARGNTKSCGCLQRERSRASRLAKRQDLTNKSLKYGGKVLGPSQRFYTRKSGDRVNLWRCQCPCGAEFLAVASKLQEGRRSFCRRDCTLNPRQYLHNSFDYAAIRKTLTRRDGFKYVASKDKHKIAIMAQRGDAQAKALLVKLYDNWCWQLANKHAKRYRVKGELVVEELVQECRIALLKAIEKWEPKRGSFTSCAKWWLRHAMQREPNSGTSGIEVPANAHKGERTREYAIAAHQVKSLDAPVGDGEMTFKDVLPDSKEPSMFEAKDLDALPELLATLPPLQRFAVERYYLGEKTLEEVGEERGVTRESIRQLVKDGLRKLRRAMARRKRP